MFQESLLLPVYRNGNHDNPDFQGFDVFLRGLLKDQGSRIFTSLKRLNELPYFTSKFNAWSVFKVRLHPAEPYPDIMAAPAMTHKADLSRELLLQGASVSCNSRTGNTDQNIKNIRGEHIPSYRTKIRRCIIREAGFLMMVLISYTPSAISMPPDYSIVFYLLPPDLLHNNNRAPASGKRIDHLGSAGGKSLIRNGDCIAQKFTANG